MASADRQPEPLTVHSSWRGLIGGWLGSLLLLAAGLYGVISAGWRVVPTVLLAIGVGLVAVMAADFPAAARFDLDGVERRMLVRRHRIAWAAVTQVTRQRPSILKVDAGARHGALAVAVGKRRYLLIDRSEGAAEYDALVRLADTAGFGDRVALLQRPPDAVTPTWLYRRRRWRPMSAQGR